jgi:WD40 repeat protein
VWGFRVHQQDVVSVALSPDGKLVLTGGKDKRACLIDVGTGQQGWGAAEKTYWITCTRFSADGRRFLVTVNDFDVRMCDRATGAELQRYTGHNNLVNCAAFVPDGRVLTGGNEGLVRLFGVDGKLVRSFGGPGQQIFDLAVRADGLRILAGVGGAGRGVRLWDVAGGTPALPLPEIKGMVNAVAFHRDGRRAVAVEKLRDVTVWDLATGAVSRRFQVEEGSKYPLIAAALSEDGRRALTATRTQLSLWDVESGVLLGRLPQTAQVLSLALSPDGRFAAVGDVAGQVRVWEFLD